MENDILLAKNGDHDAFSRLVKQTEQTLYRVGKAILKSDHECLDAAQETIVKAYLSINTLNNPQYFKTWLIRILIRECNKILKKNKSFFAITQKEEAYYTPRFDEQIHMQEMINLLEPDYKVVITLYYIEDLSVKMIAEVLEQPEGTIKSKLNRARKKLMENINHEEIGGVQNAQM